MNNAAGKAAWDRLFADIVAKGLPFSNAHRNKRMATTEGTEPSCGHGYAPEESAKVSEHGASKLAYRWFGQGKSTLGCSPAETREKFFR